MSHSTLCTELPESPGSSDEQDPGQGIIGAKAMDQSNDEPSRRRRTPRACESCRKRKIRCDGNEVCGGCRASSIMCAYRDSDDGRLAKRHIQQFDSRLQKVETLLSEFLRKFETVQTNEGSIQNPLAIGDLQLPVQPTERTGMEEETTSVAEVDNETEQAQYPPSPPLSFDPSHTEKTRSRSAPSESEPRLKRRRLATSTRRLTYADAYGELHTDEWGQLRYIGLSSAMSVIDICMPFREHINRGLEKKGYDYHNDFLGPSPSICEALTPRPTELGVEAIGPSSYGHLPPQGLLDLLVPCFYERMYFILPIITRNDFANQLALLQQSSGRDPRESDFLPVVYALVAVAALNIPTDCRAFSTDALAHYRDVDIGACYFALSSTGNVPSARYCNERASLRRTSSESTAPCPRRSLNPVIALVLQAEYLSSIGSQAEAWIVIGQAVRLGQDLGLHRSPAQMGFQRTDQERRQYTWWCIYSLDRTLSAALGRPLAIQDADCDVELPESGGNTEEHDCTGFVAILNLRRILGDILTTVSSVRTVKASRQFSRIQEIQAVVLGLNSELQSWAAKEVPESMKTATEGHLGVEKLMALSGHFCALLLLYRFFMGNPHRPSPLKDNEAIAQCARAATNCIRVTDKIIKMMPICADLVFHTQLVFTSSVILLQCIRRSDDNDFIKQALHDVEQATRYLRQLQQLWSGAARLTALVEEYMEFTLKFIETGVGLNRCAFHHDQGEFTGLEMRDESSRFPSHWAELSFKRLPTAPRRNGRNRTFTDDQDPLSQRKRNIESLKSMQPTATTNTSTTVPKFQTELSQSSSCDRTCQFLCCVDDLAWSWNIAGEENSFNDLVGP